MEEERTANKQNDFEEEKKERKKEIYFNRL